ncbi:MAG: formate dehydrogenase accessory sulfurtransferase FdhD, partial [Thermodesulfobacteriota bacterium]
MKIKSTSETMVVRIKDDAAEEVLDQVATEVRFTLVVNGYELVAMHCTPSELDALALGFLVSEGVVSQLGDLGGIEVDEDAFAIRVQLSCLEEGWESNFQDKTITSGCGYGVTFTDGSKLDSLPIDKVPLVISTEKTRILLRKFRDKSTLFK